jgi:hypothetical protein
MLGIPDNPRTDKQARGQERNPLEVRDTGRNGLINYKGTKTKGRHLKNLPVKGLCGRYLLEFIDLRYSQS